MTEWFWQVDQIAKRAKDAGEETCDKLASFLATRYVLVRILIRGTLVV
jgi:hypothetical protein